MTGGDFITWSAHKEFCCISVSGVRPSEPLEMSDGLTADKEKATETGWKEWQPEGPRRKSKWYLNSEIVEEICQERRKEMETEKETEQRELEGWREWLILLLRVHISSPPPPPLSLALSLFLEPRLSAPGSHTCGASHPIITLKWLLPHQWRTGRLAWLWSSACFRVLVTFPKLALPTALCMSVCVCECVCECS